MEREREREREREAYAWFPNAVMRLYKQGLVAFDVFLTYFIFGPLCKAAVVTYLSPDWWSSEICKDMGLVYPDYPDTLDGITEFRSKLRDPAITVWHQGSHE